MNELVPISELYAQTWNSIALGNERANCEDSLMAFVRTAWPILDPGTPMVEGLPMYAICDHLEAAANGNIKRLLITVPPGFSKSTITNVALPAWLWIKRPHLRFISASYSERLTFRDNDRARSVILSDWYQRNWGHVFRIGHAATLQLRPANRADHFANDKTGWKLGTSVGADLLGWRGDFIILDDPNSPKVESDVVRESVNRWFTEVVPTRFNDMDKGVLIVIQQRLHMEDVAGKALASEWVDWTHLNIPMEFVPRAYVNGYRAGSEIVETFFDDDVRDCEEIFWQDWRQVDGELAWPSRFSLDTVTKLKGVLGPTMASAQLQQEPVPRGGAIIKVDFWQTWPDAEPFPPLEYIIASLDSAYTEEKHNDPSAMTIWGLNHDDHYNPRIFLLYAWQEWLELHDLVEKIIDMCTKDDRQVKPPRFPIDRLLIENEASGKSVHQEIEREFRQRTPFGIDLINPKDYGGDKVARLYSVEHVFAAKLIYAHDRTWSQEVIKQCASVPYVTRDDLADTVSMAVQWFRQHGYAPLKEEAHAQWIADRSYRPRLKPLYPV